MPGDLKISFDARALERLAGEFAAKARALPLSILGELVATNISDLIDSQGNGEWAPFKASTLLRHPERAGGMLLQDTGLLAHFQVTEGPDWVLVKSPAGYTDYHVTGTRFMEARDPLAIDMDATLLEGAELMSAELVAP